MDSNTHSNWLPGPLEGLEDVAELTAVLDKLATRDLERLPVLVRTQRVLALQQVASRLHGQWLKELAGVDALGAAGAEQQAPAPSTAGWLRNRLRMGVGAASSAVRTARALFRGPLTETAAALTAGDISPAHAQVIAEGTQDLPEHVKADADPVLAEAARRLDPPRLRQAVAQLVELADPEGPTGPPSAVMRGGACGCRRPGIAWWPSTGCWRPKPATSSRRPWSPWPARARPVMTARAASAPPTP
jgi:hypothetical protein